NIKAANKAWGADVFRAYMIKGPGEFTPREAKGLKPLLLGACSRWQNLRITSGDWTHEAVYAFRRNLIKYILQLTAVIHIPLTQVGERCLLDSEDWERKFPVLVETERSGFQPAPPVTAALELYGPGSMEIPRRE